MHYAIERPMLRNLRRYLLSERSSQATTSGCRSSREASPFRATSPKRFWSL